jgi:hypothetical protein
VFSTVNFFLSFSSVISVTSVVKLLIFRDTRHALLL